MSKEKYRSDLWLIIVLAVLFGLVCGGLSQLLVTGVADIVSYNKGDGEKLSVSTDSVFDNGIKAIKDFVIAKLGLSSQKGDVAPVAVDLGLPSGTLWASCNIGASSSEKYGDLFAWGETSTKKRYTERNCAHYHTSYSALRSRGIIDDDGNLSACDAATKNWGEGWKTPTARQIKELCSHCTWTWTAQNGVYGYAVKGKNGNSIFLPAVDGYGEYWSSSTYENSNHLAVSLYFASVGVNLGQCSRAKGLPIRPVKSVPRRGDNSKSNVSEAHVAIDLGLPSGTIWASQNVGFPFREKGEYFAWGETSTKIDYTADNSMTYNMSYDELRSKGIIDSDGNLTASYDAATAIWGKEWKTPTIQQIKELYDCCTWTWATVKGVDGYKVEGKNGKHIFLPAAGYRTGSSLIGEGLDGEYWSSTASEGKSGKAYFLFFRCGSHDWDSNHRYAGLSVRPVLR